MYTNSADKYVEVYKKCLSLLKRNPHQGLHTLPYTTDTIDAMYQAEKDADYFHRMHSSKKKKKK